jgi:S-(hydroxymethyl)mycothiol dehydrogenase
MPHQVRGVIARARGAPVEVVTVHVPDPGADEVLIRVAACGVCHTDLHYREGGIGDDFPFLLGHEAAGTVETVGAGVTNVAPGAALIGCGVMAGYGAAVNTGAVTPGEAVAVIGCGGVGSAAIAGAAIAGARMVIGVDVVEQKLEWARRFGATHTVDATREDPVDAIRALTGGFGADLVVDAVGRPETYVQAFLARDHAGRLVNVGVPPEQGMTVTLPMSEVFGRGGSMRSSWYGDCLPTRDFPVLIDLYRKGRLDLDGFVSEIISVNDVEDAFRKIVTSEVLRSVVVFPQA